MKILSKLHEPLGKCNLKEFSNINHSVNITQAFIRLFIYNMTDKIANAHTLICTAVQIEN